MSGITSERAPSPTKQSTLTSPLPPSLFPHSRPPPVHPFISICNKSRKSLEKATRRRADADAGTGGTETLQEAAARRTDGPGPMTPTLADAPYFK